MENEKAPSPMPEGWLREMGIQDPTPTSKEEVEQAWKELEENLPLTTDMVQDIYEAVQILRRDVSMTDVQAEFLTKIQPMINTALQKMKELCNGMGDNKRGIPIVSPMKIRTECHSDDDVMKVEFDAERYFKQASNEEIIELYKCGWRGDYPADVVAEFESEFNEELKKLFDYVSENHLMTGIGFECVVFEDDAIAWIRENKPSLYKEIRDGK